MSFESANPCNNIILPLSEKTSYKASVFFPEYKNEHEGEESPMGEVKVETRLKDFEKDLSGVPEMVVCAQEEAPGFPLSKVIMDKWSPRETSSLCDKKVEAVDAVEEALGVHNGDPKIQAVADGETIKDSGSSVELAVKMSHSKLTETSDAVHTLPKDEVALLRMSNTRRFSSFLTPSPSTSPTSLPKKDATISQMDDSDTSDSDEELLMEPKQRDMEDSGNCRVPIILSNSQANNLRSLLKVPPLLVSDGHNEKFNCKKSVSFYDDVTVYLFDREIPTKELTKQSLSSVTKTQSSLDGVNISDDSSDELMSEESSGVELNVKPTKEPKPVMHVSPFDVTPSETPDSDLDFVDGLVWGDMFPLMPLEVAPNDHCALGTATKAKTVLQFSRFTISPTSVSRFSITPVSDSDLDSVGGSGED
ncbi:serine/threonine-protein kinase LMTK1-like [Synchiropus splendidus]|uniref:serine/threonine-protein kinase LMTK1-like n=1 Tax=Synchiropus splendidus TaxID=270530 RepID=UPI00237DCC03|nr:serine/threonine-protein kinase LMTK1-like [Synchiropus splendidus]